jgi:hypothetical protein
MTAVPVGSSDLFGEFCPSVSRALMTSYTGDPVSGLNPILRQRTEPEPSELPRSTDSLADGQRDGRLRPIGEP